MKKTFLSLSLIVVFVMYAIHVRIMNTDTLDPLAKIEPENQIKIDEPVIIKPVVTTTPNKATPPKTTTPKPPASTTPKPTPTPTPTPVPTPTPTPPVVVNDGKYKNGVYQGETIDANYGYVQVEATISGGKLSNVKFLEYPNDRQTSVRINTRAMPRLISEAIAIQDYDVDTVSGASFTSEAFRMSLEGALGQARI